MTLKRFWDKVLFTIECWEWMASKDKDGYGIFKLNYKVLKAYRYAYELYNGKIPEGLEIDHICENRKCVNPAHLEPVTHQENVKRGSKHNINKKYCPLGHEYTKENTYYVPCKNNRKCKICHNTRWKKPKNVQTCTNIKI